LAGENLKQTENKENKKNEKEGSFLKRAKNFFRKKEIQVEDGTKKSATENGDNNQIVDVKAAATTIEQDGSVAREFLQKILNDLERNRGGMRGIIFSEEFKKAIKEEGGYTAVEREIIEPEKVKFFVEAGAPYQDPKKQEEIVEKRNELIKKLNGSKEWTKNIDYYDLDIILKTLATKDDWLKQFYDEAIKFSVDFSTLKGNREPGEALGQIFSYLTATPTLTNQQIKKYQNDCLIPRDKIKEFIKSDIIRSAGGDVDEKINNQINIIVVARDNKKKEEAVKKSLYCLLGILTTDEQEKKDRLTQKMMETIEATNSKANNVVLTRDELIEDFKLYKSLISIEEKLKEAIEKNKEGDLETSLNIFNEAFKRWGGVSIEKRVDRANKIYSVFFNNYNINLKQNCEQEREGIEQDFNSISSQIEAKQLIRKQYVEQCWKLINRINNLTIALYPWEGITRTTKNSLNEIVDEQAIDTWDFLKARQEIRAAPIDISKLRGDVEEKKKTFTDKIIEKIHKFGYWLWYGIPVLKASVKGAIWTVYVGTGIKAIKDNWYHNKYPHTMYPFLSRRTGVIINAIIKRIVAAALFFYIGAGIWPNTWVEETAIKLHLAASYQKVNRTIKKENGIKKVVWVDQNGKERKMSEEDIKKYYRVMDNDNIKYLLSEEGSQVIVYLERLYNYDNKDQKYLINPQKVDDFVKYIRKKEWEEKDYIVIENKIIPHKLAPPTKILVIDAIEQFRDVKYKEFNDELKKQLALRTKEQNKRELEFLMEDFIIPNNIASYIKDYNLNSEEAKEMREIMATNSALGSMFQKGRSNLHVRDPKGLLAKIKEDKKNKQPIPITEEEIRQMYGAHLEESMNIEKELGMNPSILSNENIDFIIEHKGEFKQSGNYREIIEKIKERYTINPNMQNDFIDYLKKFVSTGVINDDTKNTFIEFLATEGVITNKESKTGQATNQTPSKRASTNTPIIKEDKKEQPKAEQSANVAKPTKTEKRQQLNFRAPAKVTPKPKEAKEEPKNEQKKQDQTKKDDQNKKKKENTEDSDVSFF